MFRFKILFLGKRAPLIVPKYKMNVITLYSGINVLRNYENSRLQTFYADLKSV
jgi:hypothetical protein